MTNLDLDQLEAHLRYPFNPGLPLELQRELIAELREARATIADLERTLSGAIEGARKSWLLAESLCAERGDCRATIERVRALLSTPGFDDGDMLREALDGA